MTFRTIFRRFLLAALLVSGAFPLWSHHYEVVAIAPPQGNTEAAGGAGERKGETKLVLTTGRTERGVVSFPMEFTAAPGETVGAIRAEVPVPEGVAKFLKLVVPRGSPLKVTAKQVNRNRGGTTSGKETVVELNISGGRHVIPDGGIGALQFSLPQRESSAPQPPVVRVLGTSPPQTEQVETPAETPLELPPGPVANPSVGCFFFSH